eukprot:7913535-Alexandrium_andersonii.AAC.1
MASPTQGLCSCHAPSWGTQAIFSRIALQKHGVQVPLACQCCEAGARVSVMAPASGGGGQT